MNKVSDSERRAPLDGSAVISHGSTLARIPNEILDLIILRAGPRYERLKKHERRPMKANWLACAQVSRRWHHLVIPHLFRCILVKQPQLEDSGLSTQDYAPDVLSFLQNHPHIAVYIHEVTLAGIVMSLPSLLGVLSALPRLQFLGLCGSIISANSEDIFTNFPQATAFAIDKLLWEDSIWRSAGEDFPLIFPILNVFSKVGELAVSQREQMDLAGSSDALVDTCMHMQHLRVSKLTLDLITRARILNTSTYHLVFLALFSLQGNFIQNLTSLSLSLDHVNSVVLTGRMLLPYVSATLLELDLRFSLTSPRPLTALDPPPGKTHSL